MAQLVPIRGIRYTPAGGDLGLLLAPPYDVVTPTDQRRWLNRNPHNALHLELAADPEDPYGAAARALGRWQQSGVVARDPEPMFYVYEQVFRERDRERHRRCLLAGVEAQPWDTGAVKPHEFTMSGPKEDRLRLLETAGVQFSPLLLIARDRARGLREFIEFVSGREPDQEGSIGGETHRLWAIPADAASRRVLAPLATESFYIADGHHRYETAVMFKQRRLASNPDLAPEHPSRFVLAGLVAADDAGLVIRAAHRVVPRPAPSSWRTVVEDRFELEALPVRGDAAGAARRLLAERPEAIIGAGLEPGILHVLTVRDPDVPAALAPPGHSSLWANLQPNILRYALLEPLWGIGDDALREGAVEYTHDEDETFVRIGDSGTNVAFLIHPVPVGDVMTLADRDERLPQKSTFFHPKLATGLVFYPLDD